MIQDFEKNMRKVAGRIALASEDKALMRERLVSYMEMKPIRRRGATHAIPSPLLSFGYFKKHHLSGALAIALIATTSTFGVTSAADNALPGDFLYPVKVNINEEIKTVLLSSDEDLLEWEKERAEMRLKEASQLASEGRLDSERQEAVAKLFAEHTDAVAEKIQAVEERDPLLAAQVSNELEVSLGTHEAVLARLIVEQEEGGPANESVRGLVEQVRTAAKEVGELRDGAEKIIVDEEGANEEGTVDGEETSDTTIVTSVDVKSPKINSANLRERAAYRAAANAAQEGEKARVAIAELDPDSELARQASAQVTFGEQLMAEGAQLLADNELGKAYGSFRRAGAVFHKVSLLLEAIELFSIEILHDTVVEELPSDVVESDSISNAVTGEEQEGVVDEIATDFTSIRDEIEDKLAQARSMLLTLEGFDEETVIQANALMKDAMAHLMRGDIAVVLGDESDARKLYDIGFTQAGRLLELLLRSAVVQNVSEVVPQDDVGTNDSSDDASTTPIAIFHRFENGTHLWSGSIEIPTACSILETGALVAESYPEQVTLDFNTSEPDDSNCGTEPSQHNFEIRAGASPEAVVVEVRVNGESREWSISEQQ